MARGDGVDVGTAEGGRPGATAGVRFSEDGQWDHSQTQAVAEEQVWGGVCEASSDGVSQVRGQRSSAPGSAGLHLLGPLVHFKASSLS